MLRKTRVEKSEMSSLVFCQRALKERIAPPSIGGVKERILYASRKTGWGYYRTRDVWYADQRVSINADQLIHIETLSGLEYARREVRKNDEIIARADAILGDDITDLGSAVAAALRTILSVFNRSGIER